MNVPSRNIKQVHLSTRIRRREYVHRRWLLLGIASLIVFSLSPVLGHHLSHQASTFLTGRDHLFNLCLIALHELLAPVHSGFHLLLGFGLAYAIFDRIQAFRGLRQTLGNLESRAPVHGDAFFAAAGEVGIDSSDIRIVPGLPTPAFATGIVAPKIYVAEHLATFLSHDQLVAVLAHENAHRRRRDPLRLSLLRFLGRVLFFLPAIRRLGDDVADEAEIEADDEAMSRSSVKPLILASALIDLVSVMGSAVPASAVGFQHVNLLERRVKRLAGEATEAGTHVTRRSLFGAGATLAAIWVSGLIMAHPLAAETTVLRPDDKASTAQHSLLHCNHHGLWAVGHLFCLGFQRGSEHPASTVGSTSPRAPERKCPHAQS